MVEYKALTIRLLFVSDYVKEFESEKEFVDEVVRGVEKAGYVIHDVESTNVYVEGEE